MGVVGAPISEHHHHGGLAPPPNVHIHVPKYEGRGESDNHIILCTIPDYGRVLFLTIKYNLLNLMNICTTKV